MLTVANVGFPNELTITFSGSFPLFPPGRILELKALPPSGATFDVADPKKEGFD